MINIEGLSSKDIELRNKALRVPKGDWNTIDALKAKAESEELKEWLRRRSISYYHHEEGMLL